VTKTFLLHDVNRHASFRAYLLPATAIVPNNPRLPLLVYSKAFEKEAGEPLAALIEQQISKHQWKPAWRWGVYDFAHYHSTAHEFLGVFKGEASIRFGDSAGLEVKITPGDVVVIPAGVSHQNLGSSADFSVVGAYPAGQDADLIRAGTEEVEKVALRIAKVPIPAEDPVYGTEGPLLTHWTRR
jgi:uncharacterized protein YjlB